MKTNTQPQPYSNLLFIFIGTVSLYGSQFYEFGDAQSPGPGWFPTICSILIIVISTADLIKKYIWKL